MAKGFYTNTQPLFLPCTYMLHRFAQCEAVVVLEEAQFKRKAHHSRGTLADRNGHQNFAIPVSKAPRKPINTIQVAPDSTKIGKLVKFLTHTYRSDLPGYAAVAHVADYLSGVQQQVIDGNQVMLVEVCIEMMRIAMIWSGLEQVKLLRSLDIMPQRPQSASEWMAVLGEKVGMTTYYAGESSFKNYLEPEDFTTRRMAYLGQSFVMPTFSNYSGEEGNGYIAWLDAFAHMGQDNYRERIIFAQPVTK